MADFQNVQSFVSEVEMGLKSVAEWETSHRRVHRHVRGFASLVDNLINSSIAQSTSHDDAGYRTYVVQGFRLFTMTEVVAATNNFSPDNKIGAGSFGIVYKGKLRDDREVAIKRGKPSSKKLSAHESELAFLSRLNHKYLVRLVGFCEEKDERLLVFEYMKNGSLYDHLHSKNNVEKDNSVLNSWKMRIQIALDAARGIEYLHDYAVPSIIHRDIKSSNILLDADWTARVSDFGLSLMTPEPDHNHQPRGVAGTFGYIDPEYFHLNRLSAKSDVYGFGVLLLELLTGKKAIFKPSEIMEEITWVSDGMRHIRNREWKKILDQRVGAPELESEAKAVKIMVETAMRCVNLVGNKRPTMADNVARLQKALLNLEGPIVVEYVQHILGD